MNMTKGFSIGKLYKYSSKKLANTTLNTKITIIAYFKRNL